ncbi:hypothetical protein WR25_22049 [Diploscapter pachys]|uniref:Uncharacterized protein n=1 Tax=Diploscapter pachys TaxID=2018661 RepID=A0A2A2LEA7_9BILA|nr:hypothetical protein WR25_22049 [Diploscapter pachys]
MPIIEQEIIDTYELEELFVTRPKQRRPSVSRKVLHLPSKTEQREYSSHREEYEEEEEEEYVIENGVKTLISHKFDSRGTAAGNRGKSI